MTKLELILNNYLKVARMLAATAFVFLVSDDHERVELLHKTLFITSKRAFYFANRQAILEQLEQANAYGAEWNIKKQNIDTRVDCALYDALSTLLVLETPREPAKKTRQKVKLSQSADRKTLKQHTLRS